jgi:TonB family protein
VVIEYKPRPDYTLDARRNKIEGDVVLELLFLGVGTAQPVRIVRGLGFGLDESAWKASREIRFLPAKSDGKAVDQLATVHFIFKLAY